MHLILGRFNTSNKNLLLDVHNSTRGIIGAGGDQVPSAQKTIEYVTIASKGNAQAFGDLNETNVSGAAQSPTRAVYGGGDGDSALINAIYNSFQLLVMHRIFGDLTVIGEDTGGLSNTTRGLFGGGTTPSAINTIDYVTISSLGDAIDFGDCTVQLDGCLSILLLRGIFELEDIFHHLQQLKILN